MISWRLLAVVAVGVCASSLTGCGDDGDLVTSGLSIGGESSSAGSGSSAGSSSESGSSGAASDTADPTTTTSTSTSTGPSSTTTTSTGPLTTGDMTTTTTGSDSTTTTGNTSNNTTNQAGCGNGTIEPNEQCDGADLNGFTCQSLGNAGGELNCDPVTCTFDTSMCMGNGSGGTSG